jgi:excisionase family DNA binding protein
MLEQEVLTVEEAARYLRVHEQTVYELLRSGRLKGAKAGRAWKIHRTVLEEYLKGQRATRPGRAEDNMREYTDQEIREFLEADKIDPETARKVEQLLRP